LTRVARRRALHCRRAFDETSWPTGAEAPVAAVFTPHGSGQVYDFEVLFEGEVERESGMVVNLKDLDVFLSEVFAPLENVDLATLPEFHGRTPTPEILALRMADRIIAAKNPKRGTPLLPGVRLAKVRLFVSSDYWVDVWP
jgi:6-pyruvoyl-tetrahydropterin synthase